MKQLPFLIALIAVSASAAAGEIFGKISIDGAPVGEGTQVTAQCNGKNFPAVKTDKTGTYNLVVNETGKCTLTIAHKSGTATLSVASYDDAAQADIVLESKDGKLSARRR